MQYLFIHALLIAINLMLKETGNCDIDFFNFCHRQVQNFGILNQSKSKLLHHEFFSQLSKAPKAKVKTNKVTLKLNKSKLLHHEISRYHTMWLRPGAYPRMEYLEGASLRPFPALLTSIRV